MNDRLTKIWLRKADGGIHFHCQIGISPGRRVLNEQSWLAYEGPKTSFMEGSQLTDRQQWVVGEECAQCDASLGITITTRHSLVGSSIPFPLNIMTILYVGSKRSKE